MTDIKTAPVTYNINIKQGAEWATSMQILDENDQPINLTGYSATMQIRDMPGGMLIKEIKTTPGTGITITALTGTIGLALTAAETALFTFQAAQYDLLIDSGTTKTYLLEGEIKLTKRVTK